VRVRTGGRSVEIPDERMVRAEGRSVKAQAPVPDGAVVAPSPLPGWPKPTDKWNYAYAQFLDLERHAGNIQHWWYEPVSLWLVRPNRETKDQGVRHKVDFMVWQNDGSLTMIEVKGHSRNLRDGITRYKIAREQFPCYTWRLVTRDGSGWRDY